MSIVTLDKITLIGHCDDRDKVMAGLQELGCLHLIPLTPEGVAIEETGPSKDAREALQFLASAPQQRRQGRAVAHVPPAQGRQDREINRCINMFIRNARRRSQKQDSNSLRVSCRINACKVSTQRMADQIHLFDRLCNSPSLQ